MPQTQKYYRIYSSLKPTKIEIKVKNLRIQHASTGRKHKLKFPEEPAETLKGNKTQITYGKHG